MNKRQLLLTLAGMLCAWPALAQIIGFEEAIPSTFSSVEKKAIALSNRYYKEGRKSLEWNFRPEETLNIALESPLTLNAKGEQTHGITLWIYNEKPQQDSLRFEFLDEAGNVSYWFTYRLEAAGWRACWMGFKAMRGDKANKTIASYRVVAPQRKGRVYFDRWKFPEKAMNLRTTPDMQIPYNNLSVGRDLWHWCCVWQWEQYTCDIPRPAKLTDQQRSELQTIEERITKAVAPPSNTTDMVKRAQALYTKAEIQRSGSGFTGAPVVAPDEQVKDQGELTWSDLETMLSGFAYDVAANKSYESEADYFTVWDYALDQGFAYGSGMGTNHHYGYQVRKIYTTAWLMRKAILKSPRRDEILATLRFWAGLQESRQPCEEERDELLDSWNTLLQARLIAAMLTPDECDRAQALQALSRWVSGSVKYSPGTIGGIKIDGTTFHHGGFYPAYTTGALATVADYVAMTGATQFMPDVDARRRLANALTTMRNYSNLHEWNTGIGGRHPFGSKMGTPDIKAFAQLALAGDLSGSTSGDTFDRILAADYLRLLDGKNTPEARLFKEQGVQPATSPTGFFVYNYGAAGIHRRAEWMVTLKGYNTNVWGAEIYAKDNRYGRYQSYGSVQIMGFPSRQQSGYVAPGWDWNRLPGTTTIHLPLDLLESPLPGTMMARSPENFAGSSSLEGRNGMFAMKLAEAKYKNFTPDFRARKSVFCFDNRLVCLGTGISNSNAEHSTETTLFQSQYRPGGQTPISVMGTQLDQPSYGAKLAGSPQCWLGDGYGNYYLALEGLVRVQITEQESRDEKTKVANRGTFASAYIVHGLAPKDATYAYSVLIQPTPEELAAAKQTPSYDILRRDSLAHIVFDRATGITAYAAFEAVTLPEEKVILGLPAEVMVMQRTTQEGSLRLSVCDPNLHIAEKTYTTPMPSAESVKTLTLKGTGWKLTEENAKVKLTPQGADTEVAVTCQHGQPVEFEIKK